MKEPCLLCAYIAGLVYFVHTCRVLTVIGRLSGPIRARHLLVALCATHGLQSPPCLPLAFNKHNPSVSTFLPRATTALIAPACYRDGRRRPATLGALRLTCGWVRSVGVIGEMSPRIHCKYTPTITMNKLTNDADITHYSDLNADGFVRRGLRVPRRIAGRPELPAFRILVRKRRVTHTIGDTPAHRRRVARKKKTRHARRFAPHLCLGKKRR